MASEHDRRLAEYERQVDDLQGQLKGLEEEVVVLRRRLQDAPKRVRTLEERLLETKGQLAQAVSQNEKLSYTLREAREHIAALRDEGDRLLAKAALLLEINLADAREAFTSTASGFMRPNSRVDSATAAPSRPSAKTAAPSRRSCAGRRP